MSPFLWAYMIGFYFDIANAAFHLSCLTPFQVFPRSFRSGVRLGPRHLSSIPAAKAIDLHILMTK